MLDWSCVGAAPQRNVNVSEYSHIPSVNRREVMGTALVGGVGVTGSGREVETRGHQETL